MVATRRCRLCQIGWPDSDEYAQCPQCMELTEIKRGTPTVSPGDAAAMRREALFGWWLYVTGRL